MNKHPRGSWNIGDPERPRWSPQTVLVRSHDYRRADGTYAYTIQKGLNPDGEKVFHTIRKNRKPFGERIEPEDKSEFHSGRGDEPPVLYRLPELIAARAKANGTWPRVIIPEGERDVDTAVELGFVATCNPFGAEKWKDEYSSHLSGFDVVCIPDNDDRGQRHASMVVKSVTPHAQRVQILSMPEGHKDLSGWVASRKAAGLVANQISAELLAMIEGASSFDVGTTLPSLVRRTKLDNYARNAGDLQHKIFEPLKFIVDGYIPEGLTILAGAPKMGKSWFGLGTAIGVAMGTEYLGGSCEEGDVLALFLEDNDRRLQRRITKLIGANKQAWPRRLTYATTWPTLRQGGLDMMRDWIARSERPRLIVVDVLARVRDPSNGKDGQYAADYGALSAMQQMVSEVTGLSNLTLHHLRKFADDDPFANISGTYGLSGAADSILVIQKESRGSILHGRGRDLEEFSMAVEMIECSWRVLGKASEVHVSEERAKVLGAIKNAGKALRYTEIASALSISESNAKMLLGRMVSAGLIKRTGAGVYDLIDPNEEVM